MIHHLHGTKRQEGDFVKAKFNENSLQASYESQVAKMQNQASAMEDDKDNFDREAFDRLKKEIGERKKLKEDMLTGTLPRFKPYLRI